MKIEIKDYSRLTEKIGDAERLQLMSQLAQQTDQLRSQLHEQLEAGNESGILATATELQRADTLMRASQSQLQTQISDISHQATNFKANHLMNTSDAEPEYFEPFQEDVYATAAAGIDRIIHQTNLTSLNELSSNTLPTGPTGKLSQTQIESKIDSIVSESNSILKTAHKQTIADYAKFQKEFNKSGKSEWSFDARKAAIQKLETGINKQVTALAKDMRKNNYSPRQIASTLNQLNQKLDQQKQQFAGRIIQISSVQRELNTDDGANNTDIEIRVARKRKDTEDKRFSDNPFQRIDRPDLHELLTSFDLDNPEKNIELVTQLDSAIDTLSKISGETENQETLATQPYREAEEQLKNFKNSFEIYSSDLQNLQSLQQLSSENNLSETSDPLKDMIASQPSKRYTVAESSSGNRAADRIQNDGLTNLNSENGDNIVADEKTLQQALTTFKPNVDSQNPVQAATEILKAENPELVQIGKLIKMKPNQMTTVLLQSAAQSNTAQNQPLLVRAAEVEQSAQQAAAPITSSPTQRSMTSMLQRLKASPAVARKAIQSRSSDSMLRGDFDASDVESYTDSEVNSPVVSRTSSNSSTESSSLESPSLADMRMKVFKSRGSQASSYRTPDSSPATSRKGPEAHSKSSEEIEHDSPSVLKR